MPTRTRSARRRRTTSEAGDLVLLSVPVAGDADGPEATSAIRHLRADLIPQAFGDLETTVLVGGSTAENVDYFDIVGSWLPIVFAFVLGLSFILLTVAFRSIVIPAVAIALNLLSVGAAYGLLVLVFQKGVGNGLFGFQQADTDRGLGAALPLLRSLRPLDGLPGVPAQPDQGALHADRRHRGARSPSASARPRG